MKTYLSICFLWSIFALYKHRITYPVPLNNWTQGFITALINFVICPIAIIVAIKNKKI